MKTTHTGERSGSTTRVDSSTKPVDSDRPLAVTYARASWDRTGQQSSVTTQQGELERGLERNGLALLAHYFDNDVSGSKLNVYRAEFEAMLQALETRSLEADYLVVYDISRLFRNRRDKLRIEGLISRELKVLDLRWNIDTGQRTGMMMFAIISEIAIERAEELADYVRAANRRRQSEGRFVQYTNPPFGHKLRDDGEPGFEVDEREAEVIRWARDQILKGMSHRAIVRALNDPSSDHHVPTRNAKQWRDTTLRSLMTAARIAGCVECPLDDESGETELVRNKDGMLPEIISLTDLHALRAHFTANKLVTEGGSARGRGLRHLLSGLAKCAVCDSSIYGRKTIRKKLRYGCTNCGAVTIDAEFLETFIRGAVLERLRSGALAETLASAVEAEGLQEVAGTLERHETELREAYALAERGEISAHAYAKFVSGHETQISVLKQRLAALLRQTSAAAIPLLPEDVTERVDDYWDELDLASRRKLIELCFESIVVHQAGKGRQSMEARASRIALIPRGASAGHAAAASAA